MAQRMPAATISGPLPWTQPRTTLKLPDQLGQGINRDAFRAGLERLIDCDGVGAVVLFGSRAQGTAQANSDLDLLVDGLPPGSLLDAIRLAEDAGPLPVGLKQR